jgi:hypothetical protein
MQKLFLALVPTYWRNVRQYCRGESTNQHNTQVRKLVILQHLSLYIIDRSGGVPALVNKRWHSQYCTYFYVHIAKI